MSYVIEYIMNKILLYIILFAVCLTISGQTISQSNNRYRGSDVLTKCLTLCEHDPFDPFIFAK
jgi:hypothetical protein